MRHIRTAIFLAILIALCKTAPVFCDQLIVPGERIGAIKLGMKSSQVIEVLGKPDKPQTKNFEGIIEYDYTRSQRLKIDVDAGTDRVVNIGTGYDTKYRMENGIQVGSSFEFVREKLGDGKYIQVDRVTSILIYPEKGIQFTFLEKDGVKKAFVILVKAKSK